jgi:hypothetical protein
MNSALNQLCCLIADRGAECAHKHTQFFLEIARAKRGKTITNEQVEKTFKVFSFLTWAYANGVWSNLDNTELRRDLVNESLRSIALKTSYELSKDKSNEGVAFLATELDQEFRVLAQTYTQRMNQLAQQGVEPDANSATLIIYEWIQAMLDLKDEDMNSIVPQLNNLIGQVVEIENIAIQVTNAALNRKSGIFSRLFGS